VRAAVDRVEPTENRVLLEDGRILEYDQLVIASGSSPRPDQTPGMDDPAVWRTSVFDFYSLEGSEALRDKLRTWEGGRLVVHITEMPIKCPVAPLEFAFLADAFFTEKGMRDRVEIVYVTPLEGAFTKPVATEVLGGMLDERKILVESDFMIERIDTENRAIVSMDDREVLFDLLVTVPLNMGADFIARSGMGDELNYVPVDKHTLLSRDHPNVFAVGDASDIPASKAGSVAHFSIDLFADNFVEHVEGRPMRELFDGHANCFVESGNGKGLLIDFNYDTEPLPGVFPYPVIGPMRLLKESRLNHWGKLGFRWIYWNLLLRGRWLPIPARMSMAGKRLQPVGKE
jgi:sulfide:quinone oxidoreductase